MEEPIRERVNDHPFYVIMDTLEDTDDLSEALARIHRSVQQSGGVDETRRASAFVASNSSGRSLSSLQAAQSFELGDGNAACVLSLEVHENQGVAQLSGAQGDHDTVMSYDQCPGSQGMQGQVAQPSPQVTVSVAQPCNRSQVKVSFK